MTVDVTVSAKPAPVDHQGFAARYGGAFGRRQDEGTEQAKLCLEKAVGIRRSLGFQGIAADQLGEAIRLVGGCPRFGPHLVELRLPAHPGDLIGRLAAREAAPDYPDFHPQSFRRQLNFPVSRIRTGAPQEGHSPLSAASSWQSRSPG